MTTTPENLDHNDSTHRETNESATPRDNAAFRRAYFDRHSAEGETFNDEWFQSYFDENEPLMDVECRGETDCGNFSSGDESFTIYSSGDLRMSAFWGTNSWGSIMGPFETFAEVANALGYDPESFPPEVELEDEEE